MKVKQISKRSFALAVVLVLLALAARTEVIYGAGGIDTGKTDCTLTFDLSIHYQEKTEGAPDGGYQTVSADRYADLNSSPVTVDLYRIASVDVSGNYTAEAFYEGLKGRLASVNSSTTAQDWEELALDAWMTAVPEDSGGSGEGRAEGGDIPVKELTFYAADEEGARTMTGLETGLYLVAVRDVTTDEHRYHFTPYLVSLPGNAYDPPAMTDDDWQYQVTVGLKPGQENRCGDLEIVKTLNSYDQTLGGASFIFEIKAEKDGRIVYSDVRSLVFDGVGTKSVLIEGKIPVNASVTVTEVYSGACYEITEGTAKEQHPVIRAEETATVNFSNDYDRRINGGTSIVNAFSPREDDREVWDHEQLLDSAEKSGGM